VSPVFRVSGFPYSHEALESIWLVPVASVNKNGVIRGSVVARLRNGQPSNPLCSSANLPQ
jgi:hypothetical protein